MARPTHKTRHRSGLLQAAERRWVCRPVGRGGGATPSSALEHRPAIRHGQIRCGERPDPGGPQCATSPPLFCVCTVLFSALPAFDAAVRAQDADVQAGIRPGIWPPVQAPTYRDNQAPQCSSACMAMIKLLRSRSEGLVMISAPRNNAHTEKSRLLRSSIAPIATMPPERRTREYRDGGGGTRAWSSASIAVMMRPGDAAAGKSWLLRSRRPKARAIAITTVQE